MARDRTRAARRGKGRGRPDNTEEEETPPEKGQDERRRGRTDKIERSAARRRPERPARKKRTTKGKNPAQDSQEVVELAPYTGEYRESRVIEVQPITNALEKSDEILFGKLALASGFVTQKQLKKCVQIQKELQDEEKYDFLGDVLIQEKILSEAEVEEVLRIQHRNLQKRYKYTRHKRDEALFGRLVRENSYASESQINECLRQQAEIEHFDQKIPLGELLISKGYIEEDAIEEILNFQKKREYYCPKCEARLTISLFEFGRHIQCTECEESFELPETPESEELKMTAKTTKLKQKGKTEKKRKTKKTKKTRKADVAELRDLVGDSVPKRKNKAPEKETENENQAAAESQPDENKPITKGWFLALLGKGYGPIGLRLTRKLLKLGLFGRDDLFWSPKLKQWTPAGVIVTLKAYVEEPPTPNNDGPPKPAQVTSPKRLAQKLEALRESQRLADSDYHKMRDILANPFVQ